MTRILGSETLWAGRGSSFARLLALLACLALAAACGDDSTPVGTDSAEELDAEELDEDDLAAGVQLAGAKPACSARNTGGPVFPGGPTVPRLIRINFTNSGPENDRNTALEKCSEILRERELDDAVQLVAFIEENSIAGQEQQVLLSNAFLCLAEGKPAGATDCASQLPAPGEGFFQIVPPAGTGGAVDAGDGFSAYNLAPGWSDVPRIVTYEVLDDAFLLNFDGPQFPKYRRYGTIPSGPFDTPGSGTIFQCVIFDDELVDGTTIRFAKNFEAPDDPNGTFVPFLETADPDDGIEYFENPETQDFDPPECVDEAPSASRKALPGSFDTGVGVQGNGKKGPSGAELAGTVRKAIGGTVSSFSEWGFVSIAPEELSFVTCSADEGLCLEEPVVSIEGNVITMGTADALETGTLSTSVHGGAALLPPASEYSVTVQHDLCTWDSYVPAVEEEGGTGFFDSFSISVSQDAPYWLKEVSDPVSDAMLGGLTGALGFGPLGGFRYGDGILEGATGDGTSGSCSAAEGSPVTVTLTMPGDPLADNYLNVVLDTASLPEANHNFPSWGTVTVLSVDTGE